MIFTKKIKNSTISDILLDSGILIPASSTITASKEDYLKLYSDTALQTGLENGDLIALLGDQELKSVAGQSLFSTLNIEILSSCAVDKNGTDQNISGTSWTEITHERILWDDNSDYDTVTDDFVVDVDGKYTLDMKLRVTNIANCSEIEMAVFKRGSPDDYWFICDRIYPSVLGVTEAVLSTCTIFDMYKDERFCLKIKLTKANILLDCSAKIDGNDDYTAWGWDFQKPIT